MAEPRLSIRSARARVLAQELTKKEQRSISQVVERALEFYAAAKAAPQKETAAEFWQRARRDFTTDIDINEILEENRRVPHRPVEF